MSVHRYRSVAEMPPPKRAQGDLLERIRAVWKRAFQLAPPAPPRGVRRFKTIEEANAAREADVIARMRALRNGRQ
jgi:hypothetical protein